MCVRVRVRLIPKRQPHENGSDDVDASSDAHVPTRVCVKVCVRVYGPRIAHVSLLAGRIEPKLKVYKAKKEKRSNKLFASSWQRLFAAAATTTFAYACFGNHVFKSTQ